MKFHICDFNYTKWSDPILGYGYNLEQYRTCKICNRVDRKVHRSYHIVTANVLKESNSERTKVMESIDEKDI